MSLPMKWCGTFTAALLLMTSACAPIQVHVEGERFQNPRSASRAIAVTIANELRKQGNPLGSPPPLLIGPAVTQASGEITRSGRELQTFLLLDLQSLLHKHSIDRLGTANTPSDAIAITGLLEYERPSNAQPDESWFLIRLRLQKTNDEEVGEAVFRINARNFDPTPSRFFQNSPIFQTKITRNESGTTKENHAENLQKIGKIDRGIMAYEIKDYATSESIFREVAKSDGDNLVALSGVYQSTLALGKQREVEQALDNLIDAAIRQGKISFKFLFKVRSTELRDDLEISSQYIEWIKRTSLRLQLNNQCIDVEGHASRTGNSEFNEQLSFKRAQFIANMLVKFNPRLKQRIRPVGYGFSKNIVGSGTDDAKDAVDRRVELFLKPC